MSKEPELKPEILTEYGVFIRKIRIKQGVKLKDMAFFLDVSASFLCDIEYGRKKLPDNMLPRISDIFNLTQNECVKLGNLARNNNKTTKDSRITALQSKVQSLTEERDKLVNKNKHYEEVIVKLFDMYKGVKLCNHEGLLYKNDCVICIANWIKQK